ncbi:MAG: carbohydrate kinase [Verrucomicrobiales bacterium]
MNKPKIISLGEVLWDLFPEGPRFGGAPANFACHAALMGGDVTMVSSVGEDARGREALKILAACGIDTALMQSAKNALTGTVGIELDSKGKPTFMIHENSAWDGLQWTPELATRIASANAVYFGTLGQRGETSRATIRQALTLAKSHGVLRVLDVNLRRPFYNASLIRESIALAGVLKLSDDELGEVTAACDIVMAAKSADTLVTLRERCGLDLIVMTRGSEGAVLVSAEGVVDQPGIPTIVVDTVGAGDSFTAAFVLGLLRGESPQDNLRKSCETASAVCSQPGAVPILVDSLPDEAAI